MPRYFTEKLNKEQFVEKIIKFLLGNGLEGHFSETQTKTAYMNGTSALFHYDDLIERDLQKIKFDFENTWHSQDEYGYGDGVPVLLGVNELGDGFVFLGALAAGDWEFPVYHIIYWDGKNFRGYVPEDGNVFNRTTRTAYGNDEYSICDEDEEIPEEAIADKNSDYSDMVKKYGKFLVGEKAETLFDMEKIKADIANRIKFKG